MKKNWQYLAAVLLLWLLFAQAVRGAVIASITFDEGPHLAVGYATLRTGDFRLQPVHIHPPLVNALAAIPLLLDPSLPDPRSIPGWEIASLSAITDTVVWKHSPPDGIAFAGRLPIILLAVLLGAFVYRWAADLGGRRAGLLALFLYALDPNIVAHGQVITTDMGVTVFGFMVFYFLFKFQISNLRLQRWWLAGAGVALGAALATKVSAGLLAPLMAATILLIGPGSIARRVGHIVIVGLITFVVVWAVYGFQIDRVPGLPFPIPAATHVKIYQSLQQHYDEGHPSFLLGMNSTRGWWFYFPVAFVAKTPLPTLLLLMVSGALTLVRSTRNGQGPDRKTLVTLWALGLFPIVHFATALFSPVDIGYRHLLPMLPFLFVFIGWQVAGRKLHVADSTTSLDRISRITYRVRRFTFYALLAWYAISAAVIFPHNLTYFNELAGGPDNGYHWLVDSNLDWGQNLKELKAWLDTHGFSQVYLSQFSPSRPEVYGIRATMLPPSPRAAPFASFNPTPGWYAIGATTLQGAYTPGVDTFAYFRAMTPVARIGHALFVYHVTEQPRGEWVAQCASPSPLLDPDEIKASFGRDDLRLVQFDCVKSWWYPSRDVPGWYVDARRHRFDPQVWYPSAHVTFEPRDDMRFASIYRVNSATPPQDWQLQAVAAPSDWTPSQATAQGTPVRVLTLTTGPLQFEGFWLDDRYRTVQLPDQVLVFTAWRVTRGADTPLSIMAHLLDAQGHVVSGSDGLGVPIEVWQTGDLLVQAHSLNTPRSITPGTYWIETGVYRLDSLDRYRILQGNQVVGDRLLLASIEVKP